MASSDATSTIASFEKIIDYDLKRVMKEKEPSDVLTIVKRNGMAIRFIENPTVEMQLAAIQQNLRAYTAIANPCHEATTFYLLNK